MAGTAMDDINTEQKLILAVIIEKKITVGGGFNQAVNAARQIISIAPPGYDVRVMTRVEENVEILRGIGLEVDFLEIPKRAIWDRLKRLTTPRRKRNESISPFEKEMIRRGVSVVYFTSPSPNALDIQTLPYIFTIWDLCHLDHPEFPEVSSGREFEKREDLFRKAVPKAFLTITDGDYTTELARQKYGGRFLAVHFAPAHFMESSKKTVTVLEKYNIELGYLFYPAQFWAHKNHARLLQAAALIKTRKGVAPRIVFSGSEQGQKKDVELLVKRLGLQDTTRFIGFVPPDEIAALYAGSAALVMPSYFGPSNLPPLEAWSAGKPVLYPKQFASFVGAAAYLFDPDDAASLADCICGVLANDDRDWVTLGREKLMELSATRRNAESDLENRLIQLRRRISA